jgi:hypothetical protein
VAEFTRPATWEDVKRLARYLEEAGAEYALIGGYALAANGLVRQTEDIDILVDPSVDNSRRWIVALSRLPDGVRVRVLSLEGLLRTKSGLRPKDQIDAAAIRRALDELRK